MCRDSIILFILIIALGAFWGCAAEANAVPPEKRTEVPKMTQDQKAIAEESSLDKERKIVLAPFFQPQRKDSRMWIERIIVTLLMTMPKDLHKYDLNNPIFRKMLYDFLLLEEPDNNIKSQVLSSLSKQLGMHIDASIQISRSIIIVH